MSKKTADAVGGVILIGFLAIYVYREAILSFIRNVAPIAITAGLGSIVIVAFGYFSYRTFTHIARERRNRQDTEDYYRKQQEQSQHEARMRAISWYEIDKMTGKEFEIFMMDVIKSLHKCEVEMTSDTGDMGVDLLVHAKTGLWAIQCKRYSKKVGQKAVREVFAGAKVYDCMRTMVITNSYFQPSAIKLAKATDVELIDRDKLGKLIIKYREKRNNNRRFV